MTEAPAAYSVSDECFDPAIGARLDITLSLKTGKDGNPVLNAARDAVVRELLEGKVEATLRDD